MGKSLAKNAVIVLVIAAIAYPVAWALRGGIDMPWQRLGIILFLVLNTVVGLGRWWVERHRARPNTC